MHIVLDTNQLKNFSGNIYSEIFLTFRDAVHYEAYTAFGEELFDIRVPFSNHSKLYNYYKDCKILKANKTFLKITIQYKGYQFNSSHDVRKETIAALLDSL